MLNTADTVLHISHVTHYDYASRRYARTGGRCTC